MGLVTSVALTNRSTRTFKHGEMKYERLVLRGELKNVETTIVTENIELSEPSINERDFCLKR